MFILNLDASLIFRMPGNDRDASLVPRLYMGMTGMQVLSLDYTWD